MPFPDKAQPSLWALPENARLSRADAAEVLTEAGFKMSKQTLARLACEGGGPHFERFGRMPVYPVGLLREWVLARLGTPRTSTSTVVTEVA